MARTDGREKISGYLTTAIRNRTFRPGDKVPSVREMARRMGVSVATVVEAYRALETEGMIRSQPQSGFYVQLRAGRRNDPRRVTQPACVPTEFSSRALFIDVLTSMADENLTQLATANPSPEVLPIAGLNRALSYVIRNSPETPFLYGSPLGYRPLREQIARRMLACGVAVAPDEMIVTAGCSEALTLCLEAVCKRGDIVAIESPAYYGLLQLIDALGLRVLEIKTDPVEGMCLDSLESAIRAHPVKAVLATPNFNNPLGSVMPEESKRRLVGMLAEREIPLIEDDVYGDLSFADERPVTCKSFDRRGLVLYCTSVSKTLAPGFRIGWVLGGRYHQAIEVLKFSSSVCCNTLAQVALHHFFATQRYMHYVRKGVSLYRENLAELSEAVLEHFPAGTRVAEPQGGFVLWVELPDGFETVNLYRMSSAKGIVFMPGPAFSSQRLYTNCLRLNGSVWNDRVASAVRLLGALARQ